MRGILQTSGLVVVALLSGSVCNARGLLAPRPSPSWKSDGDVTEGERFETISESSNKQQSSSPVHSLPLISLRRAQVSRKAQAFHLQRKLENFDIPLSSESHGNTRRKVASASTSTTFPLLSDYYLIYGEFTFNGVNTTLMVDTGSIETWDVLREEGEKQAKFLSWGEDCCSSERCCKPEDPAKNISSCSWKTLIGQTNPLLSTSDQRKQCKGAIGYISSAVDVVIGVTDLGIGVPGQEQSVVIKDFQTALGKTRPVQDDAYRDEDDFGIAGFGILPQSAYTKPVLSSYFREFTFIFRSGTTLGNKVNRRPSRTEKVKGEDEVMSSNLKFQSTSDGSKVLIDDGYQLLLGPLPSLLPPSSPLSSVAAWHKLSLSTARSNFAHYGWIVSTPQFKLGEEMYEPAIQTFGSFDTGTGYILMPRKLQENILRGLTGSLLSLSSPETRNPSESSAPQLRRSLTNMKTISQEIKPSNMAQLPSTPTEPIGNSCVRSPCSSDDSLIYYQCESLEGLKDLEISFAGATPVPSDGNGGEPAFFEEVTTVTVKLKPEDYAVQGLCGAYPTAYVIGIYAQDFGNPDASQEVNSKADFDWWIIGLEIMRRFGFVRHSIDDRALYVGQRQDEMFIIESTKRIQPAQTLGNSSPQSSLDKHSLSRSASSSFSQYRILAASLGWFNCAIFMTAAYLHIF